MVAPLIGLASGLIVLLYGGLVCRRLAFDTLPKSLRWRDQVIWGFGYLLISVALMAGILGYFGLFPAETLRTARIILGLIGFLILGYQMVETLSRS